MEEPTTLQLMPTKELIDELHNRFDHSVFVGMQQLNNTARVRTHHQYKGKIPQLVFLLELIKAHLINKHIDRAKQTEL